MTPPILSEDLTRYVEYITILFRFTYKIDKFSVDGCQIYTRVLQLKSKHIKHCRSRTCDALSFFEFLQER